MHIFLEKDKYRNYLVIHNAKLKNKSKKNIKIRFFDENYTELVKNIEINEDQIIEVFNINEIFSEQIIKSNLDKAVIQLESSDYNFDATMFCHNKINDHIAVDHLTGG